MLNRDSWLDGFCEVETEAPPVFKVGDRVEAQRTTSLFHKGDIGRIEAIQQNALGEQYPVVRFSDHDAAQSVPAKWLKPARGGATPTPVQLVGGVAPKGGDERGGKLGGSAPRSTSNPSSRIGGQCPPKNEADLREALSALIALHQPRAVNGWIEEEQRGNKTRYRYRFWTDTGEKAGRTLSPDEIGDVQSRIDSGRIVEHARSLLSLLK